MQIEPLVSTNTSAYVLTGCSAHRASEQCTFRLRGATAVDEVVREHLKQGALLDDLLAL